MGITIPTGYSIYKDPYSNRSEFYYKRGLVEAYNTLNEDYLTEMVAEWVDDPILVDGHYDNTYEIHTRWRG